jgi:lysophospholipase L1-like esterase
MTQPITILALFVALAAPAGNAAPFKFDCKVLSTTLYTDELGYGFEPGSRDKPPFYFSVKVPEEGNYKVTVTLGGRDSESITTVKAELRRLMLEQVHTAAGRFATRSFIVNTRTPRIAGDEEVRLKGREKTSEGWAWDNRITLEFIGAQPAVARIEIEKADSLPTLYIAGDSTSTDQGREPFNSWGQMLTRFFKPEIAVANHGESGESLHSFIAERRLAKVMSVIKPGDWLFIQMGHNDQKEKGEGVGAFTTYKLSLKRFIAEARQHGATPVLITPVNRLTFDADGKITNSLGDFPEAVRQTAKEENVALIDLNAMSKPFYEALGLVEAHRAFAGKDTTHHSDYGSYELAKCIVQGIKDAKLPIAKYLVDTGAFDPSHPDPIASFDVPAEPPDLPTLFLIGDSTVRNGHGDGANGQWGWGEPIVEYFDPAKINVVNRALGGRSSRTYLTEGQWDHVLALVKPGDFVMMQFGHNDSGPLDDPARARGTLPGTGDETRAIDNPITKGHEVVHTYGWYLKRFVADAGAKGATPIVCSPVPRKIWQDGRIARKSDSYPAWAAEVAKSENVAFADLHEIIARRYDELGPEQVEPLFADPHTHTSRAGAELNAECVIAGLKGLTSNPLAPYFSAKAMAVSPAR